MTARIDPISFEVIRNALSSVADEMALVLMRSAYSPVVRDSMDYSTALCDRHGAVIAQGLTLAVQLGAFPDLMRHVLAEPAGSVKPGDVFIANDPYGSGGQHLPDIYVVKPIFEGDALEGWACTMAHHSDVGGIAPGSTAIHATDIFQEGLRLPLLKLHEAGVPNRTLLKVIERNTRQPVQVLGDLHAQLAACAIGERGWRALLARYGGGAGLRPYLEALQVRAETLMRRFIAELPDGEYRFEDHIDGVGENPQTLTIAVRVTIAGDEVEVDFTGTSPQVPAAINCPIAMIHSACYCALRCVTSPDIPNCEGYMRPVKFNVPEGTILNPLEPAACAARGVMGYRVFDAIMGALAQAVPDKVIAPGEGGPTLFSVGGTHRGRQFVLTEVMVGTWGARAGKDGIEGISNPAANLSNQPIELIEAELPLEVVRYGLVPDSGGPGEHRGGLAFERAFRLRTDAAVFTTRADRRAHRPWGLFGGRPGSGSRNLLTTASGTRDLPTMPMEATPFRKGDVLHHVAAGGGGYGDPFARDPALVLEDVLDGKVSPEAARTEYGVAVDLPRSRIDLDATGALRAARRLAAE